MGTIDVNLGNILSGIGQTAKDIRQAITGVDPETQKKMIDLDAQIAAAQAGINQVEAASPNIFISGWRPAIGWLCVLALTYEYFIRPILIIFKTDAPALQLQDLNGLLFGMLGLGTMRTVEKIKDVQGKH